MFDAIMMLFLLDLNIFFQENDTLAGSLGFWMANASEFLHFLKQDLELSPLTQNAQGILAQTVQHAFRFVFMFIHIKAF